jgi:hypothetical protein
VSAIASRHADLRPDLDEISRLALGRARTGTQGQPETPADDDGYPDNPTAGSDAHGDPAALLWAALSLAPDDGVSVPDLMAATRMSRPWVYQRLRDLAGRGQVAQVGRGRWRAVTQHPE